MVGLTGSAEEPMSKDAGGEVGLADNVAEVGFSISGFEVSTAVVCDTVPASTPTVLDADAAFADFAVSEE